METARTYFTRRAGQERLSAAGAASAEARKAHLELAVRLVKVAMEPSLWVWPPDAVADRIATVGNDLSDALAGAFPVPAPAPFGGLLEVLDSIELAGRT